MRVWKYFSHMSPELYIVRWHILIFIFFINIMYTFLSNIFFRICKMNTYEYYFVSKTQTLGQQNSWLFFSSTSLAHFLYFFVQCPINAQNLQTKNVQGVWRMSGECRCGRLLKTTCSFRYLCKLLCVTIYNYIDF